MISSPQLTGTKIVIRNNTFLHYAAVSETGRYPDLAVKAHRLGDNVSKLGQRQEEHKIQDLLDQNETSIMDLESILPLDEFEEPETLAGLLG